ncbi:MAG: ribonuclease P protein component [candidate division Zixibacteria bacterium]|nr:ribonuclease P protein component [candidate division Zixibacteria bacterium]
MDNRFPAACRLKNKNDIQAVYARRDISRGKRLVFYRSKSPNEVILPEARFCFVVSKKCGHAPKRNRIKRVLRDIIRKNRYRITSGFDYIIRVIPEMLTDKVKQDDFLADFEAYYGWK